MTDRAAATKLCDLVGVREYGEGLFPVELWRTGPLGRLIIRAYNECGNNYTDVDLLDILKWLEKGPAPRIEISSLPRLCTEERRQLSDGDDSSRN